MLQDGLVSTMMHVSQSGQTKVADLLIEVISIMARKHLQHEWPNLFPSLIGYLQNTQELA